MARRFFESSGLNINWFPGHMASAARKIEQRLKVADMVRSLVRGLCVSPHRRSAPIRPDTHTHCAWRACVYCEHGPG